MQIAATIRTALTCNKIFTNEEDFATHLNSFDSIFILPDLQDDNLLLLQCRYDVAEPASYVLEWEYVIERPLWERIATSVQLPITLDKMGGIR